MKKRACSFVFAISIKITLRVFLAIFWEIRTITITDPDLNSLNEGMGLRITATHIQSP